MIYLRRGASLLGTDVRRRYAALRRPGLRIYAVSLQGTSFETRALGPLAVRESPAARGQRTHLTVVLDGALILRRGKEHEVGARSIVAESGSPWDERWEGRRFACVVWEWDEAVAPAVPAPTAARASARRDPRPGPRRPPAPVIGVGRLQASPFRNATVAW